MKKLSKVFALMLIFAIVLEQKENKYKIKVGLYKDWLIKRYGGNN
jgi:hypothetical protein